jgi:SAM-dependent methyltransferase
MKTDPTFDRLVQEALDQEFSGWDFSFVRDRWEAEGLPWSYTEGVLRLLAGADSVLDLDTGGGEYMASLKAHLPAKACATEGYPPNIPLARKRLEPLGIEVFAVDEAENDQKLPFETNSFDLVINRHGRDHFSEAFQILKPGGTYFTQQVGGQNNFQLNELLQEEPEFPYHYCTLGYFVDGMEKAGFEILQQREAFSLTWFTDIGAVVFYLKVISWQIEDFSVEKFREKLYGIHRQILANGRLETTSHRVLIEARRPAR